MRLRGLEKIALLAAVAVGACLSPGTISGDAGRVFITFLGIVAASVLPTITLLINSMTATGRSVLAINRLEVELQAAMDALFLMFGCVALAVGALVSLSIEPARFMTNIPWLTNEILPRFGQTTVVFSAALILLRVGQIPAILRRTLAIRHEIAIEEAKRKVGEKAPEPNEVRKAFATHPDFGKVITLDEARGDPH